MSDAMQMRVDRPLRHGSDPRKSKRTPKIVPLTKEERAELRRSNAAFALEMDLATKRHHLAERERNADYYEALRTGRYRPDAPPARPVHESVFRPLGSRGPH